MSASAYIPNEPCIYVELPKPATKQILNAKLKAQIAIIMKAFYSQAARGKNHLFTDEI